MDPISIITSVIAVAETALKGFALLKKVRNSYQDVKEAVEDLEKLRSVFKQAEAIFEKPEVYSKLSPQTIETLTLIAVTAKAEIDKLNRLLDEKLITRQPADGGIKIQYTAWLLHGSNAKKILEKLRELQVSLVVVNGTIAAAGYSDTKQALTRLANGPISEIRTSQIRNEKLLEGIVRQQLLIFESLQSSAVQTPAYTQTAAISSVPPFLHSPTRTKVPTSFCPPSSPSYFSSSAAPSLLIEQGRATSRTALRELYSADRCAITCSCVCHSPLKIATPGYLGPLLGQAHFRYTGVVRSGSVCSEKICKQQRHRAARVAYKFPEWIASRVLTLSLTYRNGLHMVLKAPRIVSDDAPILRFTAARDLESIKSLISNGLASPADVGYSYGLTALHIAFVNKDIPMCQFLVQNGADPYYETALRRSVIDIIRDEIINGKVKTSQKEEFDTIFEELDDYESFQLSLLHKSLLGISQISLEMQLAVSTEFIDTPDSLGRTTLSAAAWRGDPVSVKKLLEYNAAPNICTPTEISPLHRAIEGQNYDCVRTLIEYGAHVNHKNKRGRLPLHYTCRIPDGGQMCLLLLSSGAEVDAEDHGASRAIHEAIVHGHLPQLGLLISHGADVNCKTKDGEFPLQLAVARSEVQMAEALLDAGADPRLGGDSLLHVAASCANIDMLRLLASRVRGMDAEALGQGMNTALDLLELRKDQATEEMRQCVLQMCQGNSSPEDISNEVWFDALDNP